MRWEIAGWVGVEALRRAPETAELHHPEKCLDRPEIQHRRLPHTDKLIIVSD